MLTDREARQEGEETWILAPKVSNPETGTTCINPLGSLIGGDFDLRKNQGGE
jgi:hypothetical protein